MRIDVRLVNDTFAAVNIFVEKDVTIIEEKEDFVHIRANRILPNKRYDMWVHRSQLSHNK